VASILAGLPLRTRIGLIVGAILLLTALSDKSLLLGMVAVGVLVATGRAFYLQHAESLEPWPWPAGLRAQAEALARPIDPTPRRILPPDDKASLVAQVATTQDGVTQLIADKPPAWPWALFASVLVQRRNAVQARLRAVASGYQPRQRAAPISGQAYAKMAQQTIATIVDVLAQVEQFMLSPAFKGAFGHAGSASDADADPDGVADIGNRLMDYHETLLEQAENCLQTPVDSNAMVFVQDAGALALQPLIGYDTFISTMCDRVGDAQDLLPYGSGGVIELDEVNLTIEMPDGLSDHVVAHLKRFSS